MCRYRKLTGSTVWLDQRYEEELLFSPIGLTRLGRKTLYSQIDDFSAAAELARYRWREQTVEQLRREFDYEQLSSEAQNILRLLDLPLQPRNSRPSLSLATGTFLLRWVVFIRIFPRF